MRLTVLRNDPHVPPGLLAEVASRRLVDVDIVALDAGDSLPGVFDIDAVAVLGGEMGAYDIDDYPYLVDEKAFLAEAVALGVPVLGLCLGCQLLAEALGGSAYLAAVPEVAFGTIDIVEHDDVVGILGLEPSLLIHRDTWDLPPGGTLLARSDRYNQAFRLGSALGVQPHPEVDGPIARSWLVGPEASELPRAVGVDPIELVEEFEANADRVRSTAERFFGVWLAEAAGRTTPRVR
jgi:GMP synthase (glutamine-hydrolysing)